jgi:light-regulated signal transduction histidine kinase (bacteriophytochrome)
METEANLEDRTAAGDADSVFVQPSGYFLELSLDWIVLRASENVHHLLGQSHVTLIEEPLGRFVHAQALHDLRNLFSRLSGTTGIGRAYGIRLTDDHEFVDVAFQLSQGRVLLEAVESHDGFGESFGTVGGLIAGLANSSGQALLDGGTRRMRALTGFDRVTLTCGSNRSESSRGSFARQAQLSAPVPPILADIKAAGVPIFPRDTGETSAADGLLRSPGPQTIAELESEGVCACLRVPFSVDDVAGEFRCDSRSPRSPHFELHAAAELFAQLFAMRLEIDRFKNSDQAPK